MNTLILEISNGGLGDHLFYSHLPRIAKETGAYDRVLLSNHSYFRSLDYKKLVWDTNPHLDGYTDEHGIFHLPEELADDENLLDRIMLQYGLDDGKRFHEPEIYYKPAIREDLRDAVIYDPNFISYTGEISNGKPMENWFRHNHVTVSYQMKKLNRRYLGLHKVKEMETKSLFDFCSVIVSAKRIYCLTTGTATLAAALGVPVSVFYGTGHLPLYRHSKMHTFIHLGTYYTLADWTKKRIAAWAGKFMKLGTR